MCITLILHVIMEYDEKSMQRASIALQAMEKW